MSLYNLKLKHCPWEKDGFLLYLCWRSSKDKQSSLNSLKEALRETSAGLKTEILAPTETSR